MNHEHRNMIVAIIIVLLVIGIGLYYVHSTTPKPNETSGIQYLQMQQDPARWDTAPPIVYNSQLDVWLDSLSLDQTPTMVAPEPTRPFYFDTVKTIIQMTFGMNNSITRERVILVNQTVK